VISSENRLSAVAFIIFDRPELTKRLFEKMRSAKSAILLIVPLEVGQGFPAQRSLVVALAAASYVIEET